MHNFDRGMIKWAPFNSVISNKEVIKSVEKERSKIKMPSLSDEQIAFIESRLIEAFYEKETIYIDYYYQGKVKTINSSIKKIDSIFHKIYFDNQTLLFEQIIKIY